MNRRSFIKISVPALLTLTTITCRHEESGENEKKESNNIDFPYYTQCYVRGQQEWIFSEYNDGSFNYQREYMTHEDEGRLRTYNYSLLRAQECLGNKYKCDGWMCDGKLRFSKLKEAAEFIETHARVINVKASDVIYDIYNEGKNATYHVGHFWYDWKTGREVTWTEDKIINYGTSQT